MQGNLNRNLFFRKDVDSRGIGIAVEADSAVSGNVVEARWLTAFSSAQAAICAT